MKKKGSILPAVICMSILLLMVAFFLIGTGAIGGLRTSIEQDVVIDSYLEGTYRVRTFIWVRKGFLDIGEIERSKYDWKVACKDIPAVREKQMAWAKRTQAKIDIALETFEECEHL